VDAIVAALAQQQAELAGLLAPLNERDWQRPSPCEGWTVADVVLHLAQTDELALASVRGRFTEIMGELASGMGSPGNVDDGAALMVERERGQPATAVRDRWQTGADALCHAFSACDPHERVTWVAGQLSARTLATTRLAETWIHTCDVADALGRTLAPTDRLWQVARLAWRTLPYAFARAGRELGGPVAFELRAPSGEAWEFVPESPGTSTPRSPAGTGPHSLKEDLSIRGPVRGGELLTVIRGDAVELCLVAARRVAPEDTALRGEGPDAQVVLELVRTYA
jgi:uncharacterized protein (TIGR03084 family)